MVFWLWDKTARQSVIALVYTAPAFQRDNIPLSFQNAKLSWDCLNLPCFCPTGLHRDTEAAEQWKCQPGSSSLLRPRGCWLWHQLPASHTGFCHEPLRAARCSDVWLHEHARLWERRPGEGEIRTPTAGHAGWRQSSRGKRKQIYESMTGECWETEGV